MAKFTVALTSEDKMSGDAITVTARNEDAAIEKAIKLTDPAFTLVESVTKEAGK